MGPLTLSGPRAEPRNRRLVGAGAALIAVLVVTGVVLVNRAGSGDDRRDPARTSAIQPVVAATKAPSGWNMRDGGHFTDNPVVAPQAAPDGASVPGDGKAATAAGPGDFVGFQPASLLLPSGRQAPISTADVRDDGQLVVPDDPGRIGWWTGGALPGERYGGVVLAGHVDSQRYGVGVLAEMLKVKRGAVITVTGAAAGQRQKYRITGIQQIRKARLAADTGAFDQDVSGRLVLITCGGPFDRSTHHYRDNVVVIAEPVSG